jgi:hypothetical protein
MMFLVWPEGGQNILLFEEKDYLNRNAMMERRKKGKLRPRILPKI